jgi:hypothetical protein
VVESIQLELQGRCLGWDSQEPEVTGALGCGQEGRNELTIEWEEILELTSCLVSIVFWGFCPRRYFCTKG